MIHDKKFLKSFGAVSLATLLSRILGMVRDLGSAWVFGGGLVWDAFVGAFMLPNLFRRVFGEGALSPAFIPVFTEYIETKPKKDVWALAAQTINTVAFILGCLILLVWGLCFALPHVFDLDPKSDLLLKLSYVLFPYVIFICLAAVFMGILNSFRHFAIPALFPVILNLFWILSLVVVAMFPHWPETKKIWIVAWGILIAGFFQMGMQIPILKKMGMTHEWRLDWKNAGLRRMYRLFIPVIIGTSVVPINVFVTRVIAHFLGVGIQSALYFSERLIQLPLGLIATPMAQVILPEMSRMSAQNQIEDLRKTFSFGIRLDLFLTLPMMAGLIFLRTPIVQVLFEHGRFDVISTLLTSRALLGYAVGLAAFAAIRILVSVFYALQDTKRPMFFAVIGMILNIALSLALMNPLREMGLALAMSLSATVQAALLFWSLRRKLGFADGKRILRSALKIATLSVIMGLFALQVFRMTEFLRGSVLGDVLSLAVSIIAAAALYFTLCLMLRLEEIGELKTALIAKRRKKA